LSFPTLDTVDQGVNGISATSVAPGHSRLTLRFKSIDGSAAGTEIDGTWSQGVPLEPGFKRVAAASPRR